MKERIGTRLLASLRPASKAYDIWDTELPGFLVRVRPSGVMTFACSIRRPDRRRTTVTIGRTSVLTVAQARDEARIILGECAQGLDPARQRQQAKVHCLETFIQERYAPWALAHRRSAQRTLDRLKGCFPEFMKKPMPEISAWLVEKWRSERKATGIQPSTINRDITALKAVLSKAVDWSILEVHPLANVKPLKAAGKTIVRFLSDEERDSLEAALARREQEIREGRARANEWRRARGVSLFPDYSESGFADHLFPAVALSLHTGLRRGELLGLTWQCVDLGGRRITIQADTSKSQSSRHVPLNRKATDVLERWWKQHGRPCRGFVFQSSDGGALSDLKKAWKGLLRKAGIVSFRWHDMRHDFASQLVMSGVDLNTVRELLGHSDLKMTLRYAHLAPRITAEAVARLDRLAVSDRRPGQIGHISGTQVAL
jgi:integrase